MIQKSLTVADGRLGEQIRTLADLIAAREQKKAVLCPSAPYFRQPVPAAWLANMSGEQLFRLISQGMWTYVSKPKKEIRHGASRP